MIRKGHRRRSAWNGDGSDVEAERSELLPAILRDLVRAPGRQPYPVDPEAGHQALQRGRGLILDHVSQRAGGAGEGHVDGGRPVLADGDAVDQPEVDDVHPELAVDDVAHGLEHVLDVGARRASWLRRAIGCGFGVCYVSSVLLHLFQLPPQLGSPPRIACAVASFQAIQPRRAHLILAGYFDTPANAIASPSTSSSGSASPRDCMRVTNCPQVARASLTGLPMIRSLRTDTLAWLIEQPSASQEMSATTGSAPASFSATRRVTSSPQVGFTCRTSAP